jgi:hypothetical protein
LICVLAVFLSFSIHSTTDFADLSVSYQRKWIKRNVPSRTKECRALFTFMNKNEITLSESYSQDERLWALATAIVESGLDNSVVSRAKARSSMQTYRKYAPKPLKDADLRQAGIYHAIRYFRNEDRCLAAAKYNQGPNGRCPSRYADNVKTAHNALQGVKTWNNLLSNLMNIRILQGLLQSTKKIMSFLT